MSLKVDVLAPYRTDDSLYKRSRWVAQRNVERLEADGHLAVLRTDGACNESVLRDAVPMGDGVAFFGHGQDDEIHGSDERPLFPGDHAERLKGRWFHAFACNAGDGWAGRVKAAGASAVVGYTRRLTPEWDETQIPIEIHAAFMDAVTTITAALAGGVVEADVLRHRLRPPLDAITRWQDANPEQASGCRALCEQLYKGLVVR